MNNVWSKTVHWYYYYIIIVIIVMNILSLSSFPCLFPLLFLSSLSSPSFSYSGMYIILYIFKYIEKLDRVRKVLSVCDVTIYLENYICWVVFDMKDRSVNVVLYRYRFPN